MAISIDIFNNSRRKSLPRKVLAVTLEKLLLDEKHINANINLVFVDNDKIHEINKKYLNHDYPTDVISFCLDENPIEGEVYISAEMAKLNAAEYATSWSEELVRYAIHGVLHIIGYSDSTADERNEMTRLENKYLAINYKKDG